MSNPKDKFNLNEVLNGFKKDEEREIKEIANSTYLIYESYVKAGFTKRQAFELLITIMGGFGKSKPYE